MSELNIVHADCLDYLYETPEESVDLIYIDPPFNTGKVQRGVNGSYDDSYSMEEYTEFMCSVLGDAYLKLKDTGSIFVHIDYRMSHYVRMWLEEIFGVDNFRNEIIWAYDYGGRSKRKWSSKHDTIFWVTKTDEYTFNYDEIDRIPYMAPGLVGPEKAAKGKTPTDVWWHTIVPTNGKERTGYPTQKPVGLLERIVKVHSNPGDNLLDFFAGSGSFGEAALKHGRNVTLVDKNPEAIKVMEKRFGIGGCDDKN